MNTEDINEAFEKELIETYPIFVGYSREMIQSISTMYVGNTLTEKELTELAQELLFSDEFQEHILEMDSLLIQRLEDYRNENKSDLEINI